MRCCYYKICRTNVGKVVIIEILGKEYDFCKLYDSMVLVGLFA